MSELPADSLHDTLPGFHVTPLYLAGFDQVVDGLTDWPATSGLGEALAFVAARRGEADVLESAKAQGKLQPRVMHGDPKLDNVLFDTRTGQAVSLIDLDTVKPGLLHYDLGDCFRSCCNSAGECMGQGSAAFDRRVFRAILEGYLREAAHILTRDDRDYLFEAIRLLPFELGLRFLTDHLAGDVYFKVDEPGQNLTRALGQFRLTLDIEQQERAIRHILNQNYVTADSLAGRCGVGDTGSDGILSVWDSENDTRIQVMGVSLFPMRVVRFAITLCLSKSDRLLG